MLVSIRDVRHSKKDRVWIEDVYGEYMDSLADLNTGLFSVIGADSPRQDEIFANWFSSDQSHPLVIARGSQSVGFALVSRVRLPVSNDPTPSYRMSEFFVRDGHRRLGVGRDAATLIFDRFAGAWEVTEYQRHPDSIAFWRSVISRYSAGSFTERVRNGEIQQRFKSRSSPHGRG